MIFKVLSNGRNFLIGIFVAVYREVSVCLSALRRLLSYMSGWKREGKFLWDLCMSECMQIYLGMCVCVCVCV